MTLEINEKKTEAKENKHVAERKKKRERKKWPWLVRFPSVLRVSGPGLLSLLVCSESLALAGSVSQCAPSFWPWLVRFHTLVPRVVSRVGVSQTNYLFHGAA